MKKVVIYGAGGLGQLVLDILLQSGRVEPVAFLDSDPARRGSTFEGLPVRGGIDRVATLRSEGIRGAVVAIGIPRVRVGVAEALAARGLTLESAIHPLATIAPSARLGRHVIVGARALVCVHAVVGDHGVILSGSIVEHDNRLGTGVFLQPAVRLAGGVRIGEFARLGIGACVIPYRQVGAGARVNPGAVVIRDVLPGQRVGGVPATGILPEHDHLLADAPPTTRFPFAAHTVDAATTGIAT